MATLGRLIKNLVHRFISPSSVNDHAVRTFTRLRRSRGRPGSGLPDIHVEPMRSPTFDRHIVHFVFSRSTTATSYAPCVADTGALVPASALFQPPVAADSAVLSGRRMFPGLEKADQKNFARYFDSPAGPRTETFPYADKSTAPPLSAELQAIQVIRMRGGCKSRSPSR